MQGENFEEYATFIHVNFREEDSNVLIMEYIFGVIINESLSPDNLCVYGNLL
jgi:hypothetical protein